MALKKIIPYMGTKSQTGRATSIRLPGVPLTESRGTFEQLWKRVIREKVLATFPVWNSHEGEIPKTEVFKRVFEKQAKFQELWSMKVIFELISRKGYKKKNIKNVASAPVASSQCSKFLKKRKFQGLGSTVIAYDCFRRDNKNKLDAVLCAPGKADLNKFVKLDDDVANPFNFTTFALVGNIAPKEWTGKKWGLLRNHALPKRFMIHGIDMPVPWPTLTDEQQELFNEMTSDAESLDDVSKIIFIFEREPGRCGLLIESSSPELPVAPRVEGAPSDINIYMGLGETNKTYPKTLMSFLNYEFKGVIKNDFIQHIGFKTYLYGCPALNIFTHGFNHQLVEEIVRRTIKKYFDLIGSDIKCTPVQKKLFNKYRKQYIKKGHRFIKFKSI